MVGDVEPRRSNRCQGDAQQRFFSFPQGILISGAISDPKRNFLSGCKFEVKVAHCSPKMILALVIMEIDTVSF